MSIDHAGEIHALRFLCGNEDPRSCHCHGHGWVLSDFDSWHTCPIHFRGQEHPEAGWEEDADPAFAADPVDGRPVAPIAGPSMTSRIKATLAACAARERVLGKGLNESEVAFFAWDSGIPTNAITRTIERINDWATD